MEKIYMEENQQKQRQNRRLGFSVMLSFGVAIFAMFSLLSFGLAVYGNNGGISYAAPITGDSFTFYQEQNSGVNVFVRGQNADDSKSFEVPLYYSDSSYENPIYCVEHKASVSNNVQYNKGNPINDFGLLYILNNSGANGKNIINGQKYIEAWATQVSIWLYLYETDSSNAMNDISQEELDGIQNATNFIVTGEGNVGSNVSGVYTKIRALVDAAKAASSARALSVEINSDDPASVADDKSFYQSPLVTVTDVYGEMQSFDVTVSGVEGAYLVDESGNDLEANGIAPGTKFYVRIPADKVGTETLDITVNAKGHFNSLKGDYFTSDGLQKVVTVTGTTVDFSAGDTFQIIPTPATGMNAVQTIYFIGLIVLLCGVGIVYANAKPVESKQ